MSTSRRKQNRGKERHFFKLRLVAQPGSPQAMRKQTWHGVQLLCPDTAWYRPKAQAVHPAEPDKGAKVPTGHALHHVRPAPAAYVPGEHTPHEDAPEWLDADPACNTHTHTHTHSNKQLTQATNTTQATQATQ